jgi:hypothetical protein
VRKGKAIPARRFESVRRYSQERFRICPSLRGLDRIEAVIQDETGKKGGTEIPPDARPVRELVIPSRQRLFRVCASQVAELGKARVPRAEFNQLAPRGADLVVQDVDERRRRSNFRTLAIPLPLPGLVGQFFGLNRGAVTKDAVGAGPFISGIRLHWQFKDEACDVLARHSSRNYEEVRTSSSGVWEIALPGDALQIPGMNAGARRFLVVVHIARTSTTPGTALMAPAICGLIL